ncbi:MAG: hypothetical protein GXX10_03125 [Clostridiaceae bacterium]|nr:hypothetical protein [Clostridiaceae bacterium]
MADKQKLVDNTPEPQGSVKVKKPGGILHSLVVVLLAVLVVFAVSAGVFYFTVKNNINGIADSLRPSIKDNPLLSLALPKEYDAEDPSLLTEEELKKKYNEFRNKIAELEKSLEESNSTIEELNQKLASVGDEQAILEENKQLLAQIMEEMEKIEEEKKSISEMVIRGDTEGFKNYFEKVDKATAEAIYKEIVAQGAVDEEKKALSKSFSSMDPESAAQVLTELYKKDKEVLLDIFEGLKADAGASILAQMEPQTAADITKMLADRKLKKYSLNQ